MSVLYHDESFWNHQEGPTIIESYAPHDIDLLRDRHNIKQQAQATH
jgi:hypothetical protein